MLTTIGIWLARVLAPLLKPLVGAITWALIKEAADRGLSDEASEAFRSWLIGYIGVRIDKVRAKVGDEGDHIANEFARFASNTFHSNRLYSMSKGASWESAAATPEEVWSKRIGRDADPMNTSRFSGEHQL